ncbi:hypothetical protein GCM10009551_034970 [Nocardiopsis tropica]
MEFGDEGQGLIREDLVEPVVEGAGDLDPVRGAHGNLPQYENSFWYVENDATVSASARSTPRSAHMIVKFPGA